MRVGVLGTGMVGVALATRLVEVGHGVVMGSRTPDNEKAMAWAASQPERAAAGTFADAASHGEVVVNATSGIASYGPPISLEPVAGDSLAEQIQRAFPAARVVKTLNTMNCDVMVRPSTVPGEHDVFLAGNDVAAKGTVRALLEEFGRPPTSVRDVGDVTAARGLEMYLVLWIALRMTLGHNAFNIRVVT